MAKVSRRSPTLIDYCRGVLFILLIVTSIGLGSWFIPAVLSPILFTNPIWFRRIFDWLLEDWVYYCNGLLELVMGVKIKITGDVIRPGERNLILMNHRTRLDWMYFWSVLIRQSGVITEKVILKAPLKQLPGLGWAMQVGAFIFIERKWDEDKKILNKMIDYFSDIKHRTQILLFPEGTDLTARTRAKSDEFAEKNNVPAFEYVLHPRTTGFTYIAQHMRQKDHLDAVYDVTIAYPYNIPQKEIDLISGNFPEEVHFHIKRHAVQSLPLTEDGLQDWCKKRWTEKESKLKTFYEKLHFDEDFPTPKENGQHEYGEGVEGVDSSSDCNLNNNSQKLLEQRKMERQLRDTNARAYMKFAIFSWTVFLVAIIMLLLYTPYGMWIALIQITFFIVMTKKYGGFEYFQVDYYNKFFKVNNTKKLK